MENYKYYQIRALQSAVLLQASSRFTTATKIMPKETLKRARQTPKLSNSDLLAGADYTIDHEKGLRRVKPYYFTFKTWVKGRWVGKSLVEIFTTEFRDRDAAYYVPPPK